MLLDSKPHDVDSLNFSVAKFNTIQQFSSTLHSRYVRWKKKAHSQEPY